MEYIDTNIEGFKLRKAEENDINLILGLIKELAVYEKMLDEVIATEDSIRESIFIRKDANVMIAEFNGNPIGYVFYFFNYSTFIGKSGFYLEDIYIKPEYRGRGIGKEIFKVIAKIAFDNGCKRIEWSCLNWNKPSINFYKGIGAIPMSYWTVYRLEEDKIRKLAEI